MLVVGLISGAVATRYVRGTVEEAAQLRFDRAVTDRQDQIARRMEAYIATIRSAAALFFASDEVSREEFASFVQALDLREHYPGMQGIGFAAFLHGTEEEREAQVRSFVGDLPLHPPPADGRQSAIVLLEPMDVRNRVAIGYDMLSEPVRQVAMERARDSGEPAASGGVELVQEITPDRQAGFNVYVPVYDDRTTPGTVDERREKLVGWAYSPFRMGDLLRGIFGGPIAFELSIYEGTGVHPERLLFESPVTLENPELHSVRRMEVGGQTWTLVFQGQRSFIGGDRLLPPLVVISSALITLLLFAITWSLVQKREEAEAVSRRLQKAQAERTRLLRAERSARREAEAARKRDAFLADISTLLAASLATPDMLGRVANRLVPAISDGCAFDLLDSQGRLRRALVVYRDPAIEEEVRSALERYPDSAAHSPTIRRVLETGEAVLRGPVKAEELPPNLPSHLQEVAVRCLTSFLVVPLVARGTILGTLSFTAEKQGRFDEATQGLAVDLGRRIALALENARLFAGAQEAIHVRDDFLSIASHELRTPLTALQAHLQGILRSIERSGGEPMEADQMVPRLETALRQTRRLGKLVHELLDVSRITSGRLHLEREPVDLGALAWDMADRFGEEARRAGTTIEVDAEEGTIGNWDRGRIEQVIANLLSNGIRYGAGEPVRLEVRSRGDAALLRVHDRGIGISPDAQHRIFDRFERASSERHYGGLGLGLYITREIVAAHGGEIAIESAPGQGATFEVILPLGLPPRDEVLA